MSWKITMSRKTTFALLVLTMLFTAGSEPQCLEVNLPGVEVAGLVNNKLVTHVSVNKSTIYTYQVVTFTATVTDEKPTDPFTAERYDWSVGEEDYGGMTSPYWGYIFVRAGTFFVEVAVEGRRGSMSVIDYAGIYVTVEDNPDVSASDDYD